ncbi:MAG: hypothetical protein Q4B42_05295 [Oscillospiraceae bacterium]|nr:hypothetical protein [Oscillospiraceae bacterium]
MNAPKKLTWLIALILGVLGIVGSFTAIPFVSAYAFWFLAAGFALLALGCLFKGL